MNRNQYHENNTQTEGTFSTQGDATVESVPREQNVKGTQAKDVGIKRNYYKF